MSNVATFSAKLGLGTRSWSGTISSSGWRGPKPSVRCILRLTSKVHLSY